MASMEGISDNELLAHYFIKMKSLSKVLSFITVAVMVLSQRANAQLSTIQPYDSALNKSEWRFGLRYTSDYYYMGRSDSVKAPYLSPSIGYYHKSGFSVRGSLSYLTESGQSRIDLYTVSGGYDYYGKKLAVGASVYEYFFNSSSYVTQAEMTTYVNAYTGYDFSAFMLYADAGLGISNGVDLFLSAEINRTFYAIKNKLRITPSVLVNAGSQRYYSQYYSYRSSQTGYGKGKGHGGGGQPSAPMQTTQIYAADKFEILDYEADLLVSYKIGKIRLFVSSTWTYPVNPATVISDSGSYQETLRNGFYWTSGVRLAL